MTPNMMLAARWEAIAWRLLYADGRWLDEPLADGTIKESWPDPVELQLIDQAGKPIMRVPIPPGGKPIFYRRKSIGVNLESSRTDAVIFGWGNDELLPQLAQPTAASSTVEINVRCNGQLWAWINGRAIDCPPSLISHAAIEAQITKAW